MSKVCAFAIHYLESMKLRARWNAVTKAETLSLAGSDCLTVLAVINGLTNQRGICGLAAKRVIKCREFFLRKCHFYKNWIFGKVHRTILKKNFVPNSCNLLVKVSIGFFLEVQFLYLRSKYNTVQYYLWLYP